MFRHSVSAALSSTLRPDTAHPANFTKANDNFTITVGIVGTHDFIVKSNTIFIVTKVAHHVHNDNKAEYFQHAVAIIKYVIISVVGPHAATGVAKTFSASLLIDLQNARMVRITREKGWSVTRRVAEGDLFSL